MIELMVVVMLMAVIMLGLFSLQDALLQQRGRILRNVAVRNQNDLARRTMLRELASATVVLEPQTGMASDNIVGWKNLDPSTIICCGATTYSCISCVPSATNLRTNAPNPATCTCGNLGTEPARALSTTGAGDEALIQWFRFCFDDTVADDANRTPRIVYYSGTGFNAGGVLPADATEICGDGDAAQPIGGFDGVSIAKTGASLFSRPRHNWVDINFSAFVERPVPSTGQVETAKAETHVGVTLMTGNIASARW